MTRLSPDLMAGRGAEFQHVQPAAAQVDLVDGLGALITAVANLGGKGIAAIVTVQADAKVLGPHRDT